MITNIFVTNSQCSWNVFVWPFPRSATRKSETSNSCRHISARPHILPISSAFSFVWMPTLLCVQCAMCTLFSVVTSAGCPLYVSVWLGHCLWYFRVTSELLQSWQIATPVDSCRRSHSRNAVGLLSPSKAHFWATILLYKGCLPYFLLGFFKTARAPIGL